MLSLGDARRIALRAQAFGTSEAETPRPTVRHLRAMIDRLGAVQVDAVNVLVRSHFLPAFSRLGSYDAGAFEALSYERGDAFEYVGHAASFVSTTLQPAMRWRMDDHAGDRWWVAAQAAIEKRNPGYVQRALDEVTDRGPLSFKELSDPARHDRPKTKYADSSLLWWSARPSDGKHVLEGLWLSGRLAVAGRRAGFERVFDLPHRVLPPHVLAAPTPTREDAQRLLVLHAVRAMGVAWVKDVADYYRLPVASTRARLRELVEAGSIESATVEEIPGAVFVDPAADAAPVITSALLSPFDSLLWERTRNVRLLGFRHSFEIYVPEAKRQYGYYVMPLLLNEKFVARVDLKADRTRSSLLVRAAFAEDGIGQRATVPALANELRRMADWLGLASIQVGERGDLAAPLRRRLTRRPAS